MFDGQVAIVTGSARGIGKAAALALGKLGAGVAVVDINEADARQTAWQASRCRPTWRIRHKSTVWSIK